MSAKSAQQTHTAVAIRTTADNDSAAIDAGNWNDMNFVVTNGLDQAVNCTILWAASATGTFRVITAAVSAAAGAGAVVGSGLGVLPRWGVVKLRIAAPVAPTTGTLDTYATFNDN